MEREPIELVKAKGKKHLTKAEIAIRENIELKPCNDDLSAPGYLTAPEKARFDKLADQLDKLKIMGETDTETLARYITAQTQYEQTTKSLRTLLKNGPNPKDEEYMDKMPAWIAMQERLAKLQDKYFKQAQMAAASLGLTISSRCKLQAPTPPEAPKQNKFTKFREGGED